MSALQRNWAVRHHVKRNPYSEDLRKKIVQAVERGMPKIQAAKTFGVVISFIKCYVATYRKGGALAPKKRPGSKPKLDESARKLLEANLEEHPEHCATHESVSVVLSSYNTLPPSITPNNATTKPETYREVRVVSRYYASTQSCARTLAERSVVTWRTASSSPERSSHRCTRSSPKFSLRWLAA